MRKLNRWLYGSGLLFLVMFLSGCVKTGADGQPTGEGFVYNFLVLPMSNAITYLVDNFNWNYGWAIIFITIIVRIIILPLGLHQSKKSFIQTEKMQAIKPQVDVAQAKMKQASTREEQMAAQAELQKIYKENNVSMVGGIGCHGKLFRNEFRATKYDFSGISWFSLFSSRLYFNDWYS